LPCQGGAKRAGVDGVKAFKGWRDDACRGLLATVVTGGAVLVGDALLMKLMTGSKPIAACKYYQPMNAWVKGRMRYFIQKIPHGKVATYLQLATWAGAKPTRAYMRIIPSILKEEQAEEERKVQFLTPSLTGSDCMHRYHRVVDTKFCVLTKHVPCQVERLCKEGVDVSPKGEVPQLAIWNPTHEELFLVRLQDEL